MPISVMTLEAKNEKASPGEQAAEIADQVNELLNKHPEARVINIETLVLPKHNVLGAPVPQTDLKQWFRIWFEYSGVKN